MSRPVYSTGTGRLCPGCGKPAQGCTCRKRDVPAGDGVVRVRLEVKGRRGKSVTTVSGVPLTGDELRELARDLKRSCGSGGALKDGVVEIQGDHRDQVVAKLQARGFQVKRAGGR